MRLLVSVLLLVASLLVACSSGPGVVVDDRPRAVEPLPANVELTRRLRLSVPIEAGVYMLDGIAAKLEREAGVAVRFDWDGLAEVGITPGTEVEVLDGAPPAERLLAMTLFEAAPQAGEVYPTYMLIDGTAVVGTNRSLVRLAPQVSWPQRDEDPPPMTVSDHAYARLQYLVTLRSDATPLGNLLAYFADVTGAEFSVDWVAMDAVGITPDTEVSVAIERRPVAEAMEEVLYAAGADLLGDEWPGFLVAEGVVMVSTWEELVKYKEVVLYDVRDLLDRTYGPALQAVYADDPFALEMLENCDLVWRTRFAIDWPPVFEPTNPVIQEQADAMQSERWHQIEGLVELIEDTVGDPDEWLDEHSTIQELNGNFIIHTTEHNHRDIEVLLERLREGQRGTMRRFMREVEAARLLREAERLRAVGDLRGALSAAERAHGVDPGNEPARALRDVLEEAVGRGED